MNSMLTLQHELVVRPVAPAPSLHAVVVSAMSDSTYSAHPDVASICRTTNPDTTMPKMAWLGGIGSKVTTFEVFASKRPRTRPFAEALT